MGQKKIRWLVILPPWILLAVLIVLNFANYDSFVSVTTGLVSSLLGNFAWLFNIIALLTLIVVTVTYFLPVANVKFGGNDTKPMISYKNYVWIVLCTIMGAGLMLWACAEPVIHLNNPPINITEGARSGEALLWGMENIFLEWTFTPMAIYALPTLLFAFVFYNSKRSFSIGSMLTPLLGEKRSDKFKPWVDMICLFCIAAGLASTLGSGILLVSEGANRLTEGLIPNNTTTWIVCAVIIIAAYTASASSGLQRGIKHLSTINSWFYLALGLFVLFCGPTRYILNLCVESFGGYLSNFFKLSLWTSTSSGDGWSLWWPQFYWLMWLAWMPLSAVFLGRISRGFTVRQTLNVVFLIPSVFSVLWLAIFSGSALFYELGDSSVSAAMNAGSIAAASYQVLQKLPLPLVVTALFLITAFVSYVTAADSNTNAMASLCTGGLTEGESESPVWLKIFWGVTIGALCIIALSAFGLDGLKMLADLGGFPAVILMILFLWAWIRIMRRPERFDVHKDDYDQNGRPIRLKE